MASVCTDIGEEAFFLPADLVKKSVGFTLDIGSSLTKVVYRSKEDFKDGQLINKEAMKDGMARVYMFQVPRERGVKPVTDVIKEKCDVTRPRDPGDKVKVPMTGVGSNLFKAELEELLDMECDVRFEDECGAEGFKLMAELLPEDELLFPVPEEYMRNAETFRDCYGGIFLAHNSTSHENYSSFTECEAPVPEGTKPYLPCLLITLGSGCTIGRLDVNGKFNVVDLASVCGRALLGFATYMHGPVTFDALTSQWEGASLGNVDAIISDLVDPDGDSDYSCLKGNQRALAFAKLIDIKDKEKVRAEDMTLSFLRSLAEYHGHCAHAHCLAHRVRKVYYIGSVINIELMRRYLHEEIHGRNLLRPKSWHIDIHFVKQGGYINAIGAFLLGVKKT